MPDFGVFGVAAIVFVLLWLRGEDFRKRADIAEDRADKAEAQAMRAEEHASQATLLMDEVLKFAADIWRRCKQ